MRTENPNCHDVLVHVLSLHTPRLCNVVHSERHTFITFLRVNNSEDVLLRAERNAELSFICLDRAPPVILSTITLKHGEMGRSDIHSGILLWLLTYSTGDGRRIPDPKSDRFGKERQLNKEKKKERETTGEW